MIAAPPSAWLAILDAPATPTQTADFDALQTTCATKGIDTPIALLESSLRAAHAQQPLPLFVTLSGDLMAHKFDCRFQTLAPKLTPADYSAFAAKTVAFVALQLRLTFPNVPVYIALGNNDSGCEDYLEDPNSAFLQADALSFATDVLAKPNHDAVLREFPQLGDYNVALPIPQTRLLVLQDIFESKKYAPCSGKLSKKSARTISPSQAPASSQAQVAWLRAQLLAAREAHLRVWVMAHIPPGIDAYSTFSKLRNVCGGDAPESFLASEALATAISDFPDVLKLVLLGHTHMDEMRAYTTPTGATIPGKLVPSISPVNGNNPAFTLAQVNPATATLTDYTVFAAATPPTPWDKTSATAITWSPEYTFSSTYSLPDLSGASLAKLTAGLVADKTVSTPASLAYSGFYFVGDPHISANAKAMALRMVWPAYACSLSNSDAASFRTCLCPAAP